MKTNFIVLFLATAMMVGCSKDDSNPNPVITMSVGETQTLTSVTTEKITLVLTMINISDSRCSKEPNKCMTCFDTGAIATLTAKVKGSQVADTVYLRRGNCTGAQDLAVGDQNMDVKVVSGVKIGLLNIFGDQPDFKSKITLIE